MQVRTLFPLVTVLVAFIGASHAINEQWNGHCIQVADLYCPNTWHTSLAWNQYWRACLKMNWRGSSTNDKCPYDPRDCRCYNGCVADRSSYVKDVGSYCRDMCKPIGTFIGC